MEFILIGRYVSYFLNKVLFLGRSLEKMYRIFRRKIRGVVGYGSMRFGVRCYEYYLVYLILWRFRRFVDFFCKLIKVIGNFCKNVKFEIIRKG